MNKSSIKKVNKSSIKKEKNEPDRILLLDTHIWIWLMNEDPRIKFSTIIPLIESAAEKNLIRIASISVWELGMLEQKGRIALPISCMEWVNQSLKAPGIALVNLTPEIAIESSRLPGDFHGDPADRILVATARLLGADLITADKKIQAYSLLGHVSIITE